MTGTNPVKNTSLKKKKKNIFRPNPVKNTSSKSTIKTLEKGVEYAQS